MATIYKPPVYELDQDDLTLFLAGSIDMGAARDWQKVMEEALSDLPVAIFNPRRDDWDSRWEQDISNPDFRLQVEWELDHIERADIVPFWFDADSKAPVTMMELGIAAATGKAIVYCPKAFWRSGNVQIICARHHIALFEDEAAFIDAVRTEIIRRDSVTNGEPWRKS
jgi:nucleoside 2-deoxyribosyltransferase